MIEIVCPNCGARYKVPAQALGANGRDVTCSSCGNVWRAKAETPAAEPATSPSANDRARQYAGIREVLDDVQSAEDKRKSKARAAPPAIPPAPEEPPQPAKRWSTDKREERAERGGRKRRGRGRNAEPASKEAADSEAFLRERMGMTGQSGRLKAVRGADGKAAETDRRRLMGSHETRLRRKVEQERRGTGAGLTAFVLVGLFAGTLTGLYAFSPQIVAAAPETEAAMRDYVAVVDQVRLMIGEQYQSIRTSIDEGLEAAQEEG
ncbi:MAG: zinc-ribbon domain-containing protein [Paracoccaceae bacterium]